MSFLCTSPLEKILLKSRAIAQKSPELLHYGLERLPQPIIMCFYLYLVFGNNLSLPSAPGCALLSPCCEWVLFIQSLIYVLTALQSSRTHVRASRHLEQDCITLQVSFGNGSTGPGRAKLPTVLSWHLLPAAESPGTGRGGRRSDPGGVRCPGLVPVRRRSGEQRGCTPFRELLLLFREGISHR